MYLHARVHTTLRDCIPCGGSGPWCVPRDSASVPQKTGSDPLMSDKAQSPLATRQIPTPRLTDDADFLSERASTFSRSQGHFFFWPVRPQIPKTSNSNPPL